METIKTIYSGNLHTQATHLQSGITIETDAPEDNNGRGEAFSPTDLFAAAFGCCMLTVMGIAARTHDFDIVGATAETTKIMGTNPRRVAEIIIEITFPHNNYSAKERRILELSAKECPVAQSLHPDTKQTVKFKFLEII
ncbi:MAG: OsmC family protein [Prevotellaceae bacterium]|jgi:uncharacterized OsmC-like protein|nr:OsmC family protein [Prevotellaceae bacterium]